MGVIAIVGGNALAEDPVGPALIDQDDRNQAGRCDCHDGECVVGRGGIDDGQRPGRIETGYHEPREQSGKEADGSGGDGQRAQHEGQAGMPLEQAQVPHDECGTSGQETQSA